MFYRVIPSSMQAQSVCLGPSQSSNFRVGDHPPRIRRRGRARFSSTSALHGACRILVDGTKISAELNNL